MQNLSISFLQVINTVNPFLMVSIYRNTHNYRLNNMFCQHFYGKFIDFSSFSSVFITNTVFRRGIGQAVSFSSNGYYFSQLYTDRINLSSSSVSVSGCSFLFIDTDSNSGALFISNEVSYAFLERNYFSSCTSYSGCAGAFSYSREMYVKECCFNNCSSFYYGGSGNGGSSLSLYNNLLGDVFFSTIVNGNRLHNCTHGSMNLLSSNTTFRHLNFTNCIGSPHVSFSCALVTYNGPNLEGFYVLFAGNINGSCITTANIGNPFTIENCIFANNSSPTTATFFLYNVQFILNSCQFLNNDNVVFWFSGKSIVTANECYFEQPNNNTRFANGTSIAVNPNNCVFNNQEIRHHSILKTLFKECLLMITPSPVITTRPKNRMIVSVLVWIQIAE